MTKNSYQDFLADEDPFYRSSTPVAERPSRTSEAKSKPSSKAAPSKIPHGLTGLPAIIAAASLPTTDADIDVDEARKLVMAALDLLPPPRGTKKSEFSEAVAVIVRAPTRIFAAALRDLIETEPAFEPVAAFRERVERIKTRMLVTTTEDDHDEEPSGLPMWEDWMPDGTIAFDPCVLVNRSGRVIERYELRKFDVYRIDRRGESWVHRYTPNDGPLAAYLATETRRAGQTQRQAARG